MEIMFLMLSHVQTETLKGTRVSVVVGSLLFAGVVFSSLGVIDGKAIPGL